MQSRALFDKMSIFFALFSKICSFIEILNIFVDIRHFTVLYYQYPVGV